MASFGELFEARLAEQDRRLAELGRLAGALARGRS
jgi:hypothetical protein